MRKLIALSLAMLCGAAIADVPTYEVKRLDIDLPWPDVFRSGTTALSDGAWSAAYLFQSGAGDLPYRCNKSACSSIPVVLGGTPKGANRVGLTVGYGMIDSFHIQGWTFDGASVTYIKGFMDDCWGCVLNSAAHAVNDRGVVAGWAEDKTHSRLPFVMQDGQLQRVPLPDGATEGHVNDINDSNLIVGEAWDEGLHIRSFISDGQVTRWLTAATNTTYASAINERGDVAGCTYDASVQTFVPYVQRGNKMRRMPLSTGCANDLNRAGEVVGTAGSGNESYGFWSGSGMTVPLDELLSVSDRAQWRIIFAEKINEAGVIAATAIRTKDGQQYAVRLVPVRTERSSDR
jgi:hypothetical protein